MTQVPKDPNWSNEVWGLWAANTWVWAYIYLVTARNSVPDAWFALMAKTEVEWWSNWLVCWEDSTKWIASWWITKWQDLKAITTCTKFTKVDSTVGCAINSWDCKYTDISELRYLLVY